MAQYLLSVWHDSEYVVDFTSDEARVLVEQVSTFNSVLAESGAMVFAAGLQPASTASVTTPGGKTTSGPYADESKQMGGFWIIEVDTAERAQDWAERAAAACAGPVELRPFQTGDE